MKTKTMRTAIISLLAVGLVAMGTAAFAGEGMGARDDDGATGGYGRHHRGVDCPYGNPSANLTPEQREQLDAERQAFFEATKIQRQDLHAKRLELRAEMAKRDPDMKKATALQKEVSGLQGNLAQQRLTHIMNMRKINPDAGMGFFGGGRVRGGHGHHRGYGQGMGGGPGFCRQ
jgi:zinc resistance-associated protein